MKKIVATHSISASTHQSRLLTISSTVAMFILSSSLMLSNATTRSRMLSNRGVRWCPAIESKCRSERRQRAPEGPSPPTLSVVIKLGIRSREGIDIWDEKEMWAKIRTCNKKLASHESTMIRFSSASWHIPFENWLTEIDLKTFKPRLYNEKAVHRVVARLHNRKMLLCMQRLHANPISALKGSH